jgi:hypothetical protein
MAPALLWVPRMNLWKPVALASTAAMFVMSGHLTACTIVPSGADAGSSSGGPPPGGGGDDGGVEAPQSGPWVPGAHPAPPQVVNEKGGPVMATPAITVVTFNADPMAAQLEDFGNVLGQSAYWTTVTSEYGIGPMTANAPRREQYAWPTSTGKADYESYLVAQLDGTGAPWGTPDPSTIYALFFPDGITVSDGTVTGCQDSFAWHAHVTLPQSGVTVVYFVSPLCAKIHDLTGIDGRTATATHELAEAVTDPLVNLQGAYNQLDPNHRVWILPGPGGEIGDLCVAEVASAPTRHFVPDGLGYYAQRIWSNASASAGHTPCVPAMPGQVFFDSVPVLPDTVTYKSNQTQGVQIAVGGTQTIDLDLWSDAPTSGPWTVDASETQKLSSGSLALSLDATSGQNGDTLHLTIQVVSASSTGMEMVKVQSTLGSDVNAQYFLVTN